MYIWAHHAQFLVELDTLLKITVEHETVNGMVLS